MKLEDKEFLIKGEDIIQKFIREDSEMEININRSTRDDAVEQFRNSDISGILSAKRQIVASLRDDSFVRFLHSKVFKRYLLTKHNLRYASPTDI